MSLRIRDVGIAIESSGVYVPAYISNDTGWVGSVVAVLGLGPVRRWGVGASHGALCESREIDTGKMGACIFRFNINVSPI